MTTIGFIGATGRLGQELAKGLIKAEGFDEYKAFLRKDADPDKVEVLKELGYEIVNVDFDDGEALEQNFAGVKTLVSTIGGGPLWRVETVSVERTSADGAEAVLVVESLSQPRRTLSNASSPRLTIEHVYRLLSELLKRLALPFLSRLSSMSTGSALELTILL